MHKFDRFEAIFAQFNVDFANPLFYSWQSPKFMKNCIVRTPDLVLLAYAESCID